MKSIMYIDPEGTIVGVPNIEVRDFLRRVNDSEWTRRYLADLLSLSQQRGAKLLTELLQLGYIEFTESRGKKRYFKRSLRGARFSLASAARSLTRSNSLVPILAAGHREISLNCCRVQLERLAYLQ